MRYHICLFLSLTILFALRGSAKAQTVYGPGGLFVHPSAFVPRSGALDMNVSWFTQKLDNGARTEWLPVSLTYGVTDRAEIGVLYLNRHAGGRNGDSGGVFAKYQLVPDTPARPAVALAGSFLGGDVRQSSLSGVLSHNFMRGERVAFAGHVGFQWARRADIPIAQDDVGAFLGLEVPLGVGWKLIGEAGTRFRFDHRATSAIGVVWTARNGIHAGIAYVNIGRSDDNRFLIGVGYPLGGNK